MDKIHTIKNSLGGHIFHPLTKAQMKITVLLPTNVCLGYISKKVNILRKTSVFINYFSFQEPDKTDRVQLYIYLHFSMGIIRQS